MTRKFDVIAIGTGISRLGGGIALSRSRMAGCDCGFEAVRRYLRSTGMRSQRRCSLEPPKPLTGLVE